MEKVLVKVNGLCIFSPDEEQWAGLDSQMKTIVKKVGGLIDVPLKDRLVAEYNTCKVHKKFEMLHDDRVPQLLLDNLYPQYLKLYFHQYNNNGADRLPDSTAAFLNAIKNDTWKQFQKKEKIRLKNEMTGLLKWQNKQTKFSDFEYLFFKSMMTNDNFYNLGNKDIDNLALQFTAAFQSDPANNTLDQIDKSLFISQKPLIWQYQQSMNSNRTLLNQFLHGAVSSFNSVADKFLRSSRSKQFEMLTSENKFFVIKSLREHEVMELAFIRNKPYALKIASKLIEKCKKSTEQWFNDELRELSTLRYYKNLQSYNLPLLTYHLHFISKNSKDGLNFKEEIKKYLEKISQCLDLEDDYDGLIPIKRSPIKSENSKDEISQVIRLSQEVISCTCCSYVPSNGPDADGTIRQMLGCINCNILICEEPCYSKYKQAFSKKEKRTVWDYQIEKWIEKETLKELFCPSCRKCDWNAATIERHKQRADDILKENEFEIAEKLEQHENIKAAKLLEKELQKEQDLFDIIKPIVNEFEVFPGQIRIYISQYLRNMQQKQIEMIRSNPIPNETISNSENEDEEFTSEYFYNGGMRRFEFLQNQEDFNQSPDQIDSRARPQRQNTNLKNAKCGFKYEDDDDYQPERKRRKHSSQRK